MSTKTTTGFSRRVTVGTIESGYKARATVSVDIEWNGDCLSISGTVKRPGAADIDSGGQILDDVAAVDAEHLAIPAVDRDRLLAEWRAWHLNDMRAGCSHQRAEGWDRRPIDPTKPTDAYGLHFDGQSQDSWNMLTWVRPDEHPDGLLTKACPVCGYGFGTAWLSEPVPDEVLTWLAGLGVAR